MKHVLGNTKAIFKSVGRDGIWKRYENCSTFTWKIKVGAIG